MKSFFLKYYPIILKYCPILLSQIIILTVANLNRFPDGYAYAGLDMIYPLDLSKCIEELSSIWGRSSLGNFSHVYGYVMYYYLIYLLSLPFRLSASSQSIVYMYIFLFSSYWGMYYSIKLFDVEGKTNHFQKNLFAFLYTFNFYTVYVFYFQYGYSPFLLLYPIFPCILATTHRYFLERKYTKQLYYLCLIIIFVFLSSIPNSHIPFLSSMTVVISCFILLSIFLKRVSPKELISSIKKTALFYFAYFITLAWVILPQFLELLNIYKSTIFVKSNADKLLQWILTYAIHMQDIFSMGPPYKGFYYFNPNPFMIIISFTWMMALIASIIIFKRKGTLSTIILFILMVCIFLANKGVGFLSNDMIGSIFSNPILAPIRTYDKALVYLPFLVLIIIFINIKNHLNEPLAINILYGLVVLQLIVSYPLWSGHMEKKYAFHHNLTTNEDYKTAKQSALYKMPDEYVKMATALNKVKGDYRILSMPYYDGEQSLYIATYPNWRLHAADPTLQLYSNPVVEMNTGNTPVSGWNFGKDWEEDDLGKSEWILNLSSILNIRYWIFHKDIDPAYISKNMGKIHSYETTGEIIKEYTGDYIDIYKINPKYFTNLLYVPKQIRLNTTDHAVSSELFSDIGDTVPFAIFQKEFLTRFSSLLSQPLHVPEVSYRRVSPVKYEIQLKNIKAAFPLIFLEKYHIGWGLYANKYSDDFKLTNDKKLIHRADNSLPSRANQTVVIDASDISYLLNKPIFNDDHIMANGYANAWIIDPGAFAKTHSVNYYKQNTDGTIDINLTMYFSLQSVYYLGLLISLSSFLVGLTCLFVLHLKKETAK